MSQETVLATEDKKLRTAADKASTTAKEMQMRLDAYRWEQCACPDGPQYSQREYAKIVGVTQQAISQSVKAWADNRTVVTCTLGAPHPKESEQPTSDKVDTGDTDPDDHSKSRISARVGDENAEIVAILSGLGSVAESTITNNANWSGTLSRAKDLVREGKAVKEAARTAYDERLAEQKRITDLRAKVKKTLKDAGLDHGKKDIDAIMGASSQPPTWKSIERVIDEEIKRQKKKQDMERTRKEREAEEDSRPAWLLPILGVAESMAAVGQSEWDKISGDVSARTWSEDDIDLLNSGIDKAQAILDRLRLLPTESALTVDSIIEGGAS